MAKSSYTANGFWERRLVAVRIMRSLIFGDGAPVIMPAMFRAFRTTEATSGSYEMRFKFRTLKDMQAADREWHAMRSAIANSRNNDGR